MSFSIRTTLLALFSFAFILLSGCATTDSDNTNVSSRPWNSPKGWETGGLPSMLNEGR